MQRPSTVMWEAEAKFEEWWGTLTTVEKTQIVATGAVVFIYLASVIDAIQYNKRHRQ